MIKGINKASKFAQTTLEGSHVFLRNWIAKMKNSTSNYYMRSDSIVFKKNNESFGGLSNMSSEYKINLNDFSIRTVEALYQALKFPNNLKAQEEIIIQKSPMAAKYKARSYHNIIRSDWEDVKLDIMYWCLKLKLFSNWDTFSKLLIETGSKFIVEESNVDNFWGAKPLDENSLVGENQLGILLMKLRNEISTLDAGHLLLRPLEIRDFVFMGIPIGQLDFTKSTKSDSRHTTLF